MPVPIVVNLITQVEQILAEVEKYIQELEGGNLQTKKPCAIAMAFLWTPKAMPRVCCLQMRIRFQLELLATLFKIISETHWEESELVHLHDRLQKATDSFSTRCQKMKSAESIEPFFAVTAQMTIASLER